MPQHMASLRCFHAFGSSDWLRLGPMKIQINSHIPFHIVIKELIQGHECDRMQRPLTMLLDKRSKEKHGKPTLSTHWIDIRVMKK